MAKDIKRHITHLKSKVVESNAPKLITASDLYEGEIAVNYAKGYETLSIKNESGDVVTFLPRPYNSARGGETIHPIFNGTGTAGGTNLSAAWSGECEDVKTLYDGLTILYKVNTAGHASGDTLSINGGEAHKVLLNATGVLTTHYPVGSIIKLTYDSSQSASFYTGSTTQKTTTGVWKIENYDSNSNTTHIYDTYYNGSIYKAGAATYRYQILLSKNETTLIPVSNGNNNTANTKTITTEEFNPFAPIFYYNSTATTNASTAYTSGVLNDCMTLNLTLSFNVASVLTAQKDVYIVAEPQSNGKVKLRNPSTSGVTNGPISQTLPTTDDGYVYIYLGAAYSTTSISLARIHPVYQFKNGQLRQYVGNFGTMAFTNTSSYSSATEVNTALSGKSNTGHTHDDRYYTEAELTGSSTTVVVAKASSATTAASAAKLSNTSAIGSGTQPIFFTANGVPSATTYSLSKSVPSNAVFTDTATTLSGHYTITATTADTKSANASSTSELAWGSSVVTGVTISGDAKGHITAVSVASGKLKTPVTGVTLASGTNNGTVKLTVNGSATDNIAVKGLGTAAYKAEGYFAGSGHSHTNMVTGSSLTANNIILGNGSSAIKDSGKSIETTLSSTLDTTIPTSKAVATYVTSQMTSVLTYKGAISANATLQNAHKVGDVYVVSSAGTYAGKACEVGDYLIANTARESASTVTNADWDAINGENQVENKSASLAAAGSSATLATVDGTNITVTTPSTWTGVAKTGTVTKVSTASGLTGGDITSTGTIGLAATGTAGTYYRVVTDAYGRVTSGSSTSPNTDTAVTQTNTTTNGSYEVLLAGSTATATTTEGSSKNVGMTYNPSTSALTVNKKITTIAANNFITGSGTAGSSGGTPTTYYPAKWTFNKGITVADGDMFTIKIPVAGHTYGTYLSLNNGTNYYPVVINSTTRLTTQYPVNNYITVVYETGGTATSIYPVTGGTTTGTSAAGVFRVINFYDSNTTYSVVDNTYLRYNNLKAASIIYRYQLLLTKNETSLLPIASVDNVTGTSKTITDSKFDPFGNIYYYSVTASTAANAAITTGRTYQQILFDLRYSFNTATALVASKSVYMVATPQSDGTAILANRTTTGVSATGVISQTLPTTDDGYIYIYLGTAYSTYQLDLSLTHPVYQFKNGQLRQYVGSFGSASYKDEGYFAGSGHTHATSIATSTGTNQLTLGFGSKYSLNAGGTSYIFTMPSSASSWNSVTSVTTSSTAGNISVNGSNVAVAGLGGAAYLNTGTTVGTVSDGGHTHDGRYAKSAFTKVMINTTALDADSTGDTFTISGGSFISLTADATNDKVTIAASTGTSNTTLARGDHSHSAYAVTGRTISTASGLTGGGNLSADRTIGLAATGTAGTYSTVVVDAYGRVTSGNSSGGASANYFIIGDTEGSASVPEFDAYTDTVHVTAQELTTAQKAQARTNIGAISSSDISGMATQTWVNNQNFEKKTSIVVGSGTALSAAIGNYYRYDSAVGTLTITLPVPSDTTHLSSIIFAFTTDSTTNVAFTSTATIMYHDGFEIEASSSYEVNAIYNGSYWALAAIKLVSTL